MNLALIAIAVICVPLGLAFFAFVIWLVIGYLSVAVLAGAKWHRKRAHPDET